MEDIEMVSRPLLTDRLQVYISPKWTSINEEDLFLYDGNLHTYLFKESPFKIVRFNRRPYIQIPDNWIGEYSKYVKNTRISIRHPFTVTTEFNFIRFLKSNIENDESYDKNYADSIRINEDNFISYNDWKNWDSRIIKRLAEKIPNLLKDFANDVMQVLIPEHEINYEILSLKHAEYNIDYYVGRHKSLGLQKRLNKFILSKEGNSWRNELEAISVNQYSPKEKFDRNLSHKEGCFAQTIKFYICKGCHFKIYQKTTDHIRAEITFEGNYIKRKFGTYKLDYVYDPLRKYSKDFFKNINFEGILYLANKDKKIDVVDDTNVSKIYKFLDATMPQLSNILDNVIHNEPISNPTSMQMIKKNPEMKRVFSSVLTKNGMRIYKLNSSKWDLMKNIKAQLVKKPVVKRLPLLVCEKCGKKYRGNYCNSCRYNDLYDNFCRHGSLQDILKLDNTEHAVSILNTDWEDKKYTRQIKFKRDNKWKSMNDI